MRKIKWSVICLLLPTLFVVTCADNEPLGPPQPKSSDDENLVETEVSDAGDEEETVTIDGEVPTCLENQD